MYHCAGRTCMWCDSPSRIACNCNLMRNTKTGTVQTIFHLYSNNNHTIFRRFSLVIKSPTEIWGTSFLLGSTGAGPDPCHTGGSRGEKEKESSSEGESGRTGAGCSGGRSPGSYYRAPPPQWDRALALSLQQQHLLPLKKKCMEKISLACL